MGKVAVYNLEGKKAGDIELNDAVFGVEINPEVVQFVANAQRGNAARPYAHTKQRGEVRGGGKKPWRQKGTGRARHGSSRSPLWRGGAVTFGPTKFRNQFRKVNKKQRRKALMMVLSDKLAGNNIIVVESFEGATGKTKQMSDFLAAVPMERQSGVIALGEKNELVTRSAQNVQKVNTMLADSLNVYDLLQHRYLIIDKAGVEKLEALLG